MFKTTREGDRPDDIAYYPSMEDQADSNRSLEARNLLVFSNAVGVELSEEARECDQERGERPCLSKGCFRAEQRCDGRRDCE